MSAVEISAVIRQPEIIPEIRVGARWIAEQLSPYECLTTNTRQTPAEQIVITSILREEGVLSQHFIERIEAYAATVAKWMASFWKKGNTRSQCKRQLQRAMNIMFGWSNEFLEKGRPLAAHFIREALWRGDTACVETLLPHPTLRPHADGLVIEPTNDSEAARRLAAQVAWIQFRDFAVLQNWRPLTRALPKEYYKYPEDLMEILDANLIHGEKVGTGKCIKGNILSGFRDTTGIIELSISPAENNPFIIASCNARTRDATLMFGISRFNCELVPNFFSVMSVRGMFAPYNEPAYEALKLSVIAVIYDSLTNGLLQIQPWINEPAPDDTVTSEETPEESEESAEIMMEFSTVTESPEPAQEMPGKTSEVPTTITAPPPAPREQRKNSGKIRSGLTWRGVMRTLKSFGITVEWTDHPMLCRDGKRVRYPNPHNTDVKTNARYLHHALKAFGIPREEFYARL